MTLTSRGFTRVLVLLMLIALPLAGCETPGSTGIGTKTAIGGLGGAAAGGLLGAALGGSGTGIAAGTILGGLIGGALGNRMDAADQQRAQETATRALETVPSGRSVAWQNPDSGNTGSVMPTRTYQTSSGQYCREYQQTITISGERHQSHGTACRQPDGTWRIVS
jgi:surface antigen